MALANDVRVEVSMAVNTQAELDAEALLSSLQVDRPPIDPIRIAVALGLKVWTSDLADDLAGVLVKIGAKGPVIYLNAHDSVRRQRFTCAHELGHFFQRRRDGGGRNWNFVDYRNDLSASGTDAEEIYANGFAAALLMPAAMVREHHGTYDADGLANLFKVSGAAMSFRLRNLGLA